MLRLFRIIDSSDPGWNAGHCRNSSRLVVGDPNGLAALARPRNHDNRRVLERGGHQFAGKARKEHMIGIVHAGWRLRLFRINVTSIPDYRLV